LPTRPGILGHHSPPRPHPFATNKGLYFSLSPFTHSNSQNQMELEEQSDWERERQGEGEREGEGVTDVREEEGEKEKEDLLSSTTMRQEEASNLFLNFFS
jgi:hypothetical protein